MRETEHPDTDRERMQKDMRVFLSKKGNKIQRIAVGVSGVEPQKGSTYETQNNRKRKKGRGPGITINPNQPNPRDLPRIQ